MEDITDYHILEKGTINNLQEQVKLLINRGWAPLGAAFQGKSSCHDGTNNFFQTMVKHSNFI